MFNQKPYWTLLVVSLPTDSATARMRIWRALKSLGCGALRDGVYLLPCQPPLEDALRQWADETIREGGSAWLLHITAKSAEEETAYRALFDRSEDYAQIAQSLSAARKTLSDLTPQEATRLIRRLRKECEAISSIDYFPSETSVRAEALWQDFVATAETILSPGEPQIASRVISKLDRHEYQGRIWATRRTLWVDRVASAWLIRRFIDKDARFLWLASPTDCPQDALGFDFDGAAFTHVGNHVTFETLLASFGLDADVGLVRLGAMVHALDLGDITTPEGHGFEAILVGARQRCADDDKLLDEISTVLDSLHTYFKQAK
ncbi:MAG: chromate resistance protein [Proteobacteria bacterium]|nr:chromate resistance protein [Pseudomonadota bacterium]